MAESAEPEAGRDSANTNVAILGVGLIGGSVGLALRKSRARQYVVTGFDDPAVLDVAERRGVLDRKAASPEQAVEGADIVILAAPVVTNLSLLSTIAAHLRSTAIVTDVGSVKSAIEQRAAEVLPDNVAFIGGHPMTGSERSGVEHADEFLFENATYVLCPPAPFPFHPSRYEPLLEMLRALGARVLMMSSDRHDRIAATVSHLPQLVAVALSGYAASENATDENVHKLAAGGFRDMTRIAASPFDLWEDILVANHGAVLDALAAFAVRIQRIRNRLIEDNATELRDDFDRARAFRESVPATSKGFLHPISDVYVSAADRPGVLQSITNVLAESGLNIKDIELLKLREGTGGTFRIGFDNERDAETAVDVLTSDGHPSHRL